MTKRPTSKCPGGHGGGVIREGAGQHTVKKINADEQAQKRREAQGRKKPGKLPSMYTPKAKSNHTKSDIELRLKSICLIENGNEDSLLEGICKFVNMPNTDAYNLLVEAIYQKDGGYSFIQAELGITIPAPKENFYVLLRELAHQFRKLNNQNSFFKESYTLPEQKDHPITVAYRTLSFGDSESIDTICARNLVTTACRYFINSNDGHGIGEVWYFLMAENNPGYNFGGLAKIFNFVCSVSESRAISNWLLPLHTKIFNLFKAMVAEEKPKIYEDLIKNPSHYHYCSSSLSSKPVDLPYREDNLLEEVPVKRPVKSLTYAQITDTDNHPAFDQFLQAVDAIRGVAKDLDLFKVLKNESKSALHALFAASSDITAIVGNPTLANIASNINKFNAFAQANSEVGNALQYASDTILDSLDVIKAFVDAATSIETALDIDTAADILKKENLIRMNMEAANDMT